MPNKRPNFQRIIQTNDPPKVIEPPREPDEPKETDETYFQKRTVRFDLPKTPSMIDEPYMRPKTNEETKPYYEPSLLFANPRKDTEEEDIIQNGYNTGYYSLRKNYQRIKPGSKYVQEGLRPASPNIPYSFLSPELIKANQQVTKCPTKLHNLIK